MHRTMLAIILCSTFALPAKADTISGGKIASVDSGGKSFHYSWRKKHWTFKTTDTTAVRVGNKTGSLSDIKAGHSAKAEVQRQGDERIAGIIIGTRGGVEARRFTDLGGAAVARPYMGAALGLPR